MIAPGDARLVQIGDARLLQNVDAAFADAAERSGAHLVCRPGCTQCCHGAFAINPLDAARLRHAMVALAADQPVLAARLESRARAYLEEFATSFPGDPVTGLLDESDEAQAAFEEFANDAACPALNLATGLCDVYEARPMTCRVFGPPIQMDDSAEENEEAAHGLAICELCFTAASPEEIAAAEMHVPHQEEARLLEAFHQKTGIRLRDSVVAYCLVPPILTASSTPR